MKNFILDIKKVKTFSLLLLAWLFVVGIYQTTKKMPQNTDYRGAEREISVESIRFLYDLTYKNAAGELISEQVIFDEILSLIEGAKSYRAVAQIEFYLLTPAHLVRLIFGFFSSRFLQTHK